MPLCVFVHASWDLIFLIIFFRVTTPSGNTSRRSLADINIYLYYHLPFHLLLATGSEVGSMDEGLGTRGNAVGQEAERGA